MSSLATISRPPPAGPAAKCRLCRCRLEVGGADDHTRELCGSCKGRPEVRRLGQPSAAALTTQGVTLDRSARAFTAAEKALIGKVHGYMPAPQLLAILNERLLCDLGPDATPYTMEQLFAEIGGASAGVPAGGHDWASLRKVLSRARSAGVLGAITESVINDFAVVFSLNQKQLLVLKDIVLQGKEG